jgi:hypothetical protein
LVGSLIVTTLNIEINRGELNMATVLVKHKSMQKKGVSYLTTAKESVQHIRCFYEGGDVQTQTGDVWKVKPCSSSKADYETVGAIEA